MLEFNVFDERSIIFDRITQRYGTRIQKRREQKNRLIFKYAR